MDLPEPAGPAGAENCVTSCDLRIFVDDAAEAVPSGNTHIRHGSVALADRGGRETGGMASSGRSSVFAGFRFPREVIAVAVRWYLRYGLSYRDVEELLAERGVTVDHVTLYRWVQRFTPEFIEGARFCRHACGRPFRTTVTRMGCCTGRPAPARTLSKSR